MITIWYAFYIYCRASKLIMFPIPVLLSLNLEVIALFVVPRGRIYFWLGLGMSPDQSIIGAWLGVSSPSSGKQICRESKVTSNIQRRPVYLGIESCKIRLSLVQSPYDYIMGLFHPAASISTSSSFAFNWIAVQVIGPTLAQSSQV